MNGRPLDARMFTALSATNEAILRSTSPEELYQKVCDAAVYGGDIKFTGALLPLPDGSLRIAAATSQSGPVPPTTISVDPDCERGQGPSGIAFRSGRSATCNDVFNDPKMRPWIEENRRNGIGAVAAVPILRAGTSIGVFLFCLGEAGALTSEIVALLERMVENVSFALDGFDRERQRRQAEAASQRAFNIFKALSATNEAILRSSDANEMMQKVAQAVVDGGKLLGAAIFLKAAGMPVLRLAGHSGPVADIIAQMKVSVDPDVPEGKGLGGSAFRTNQPTISNDVPGDMRIAPWRDLAIRSGLTACAALPIRDNGAPIGIMYFFYSEGYGQIEGPLIELMSRIAANVSFGLTRFEQDRARRDSEREQENLNRMYVALSATNEAIMRGQTRDELLGRVCDAAVLGGKFTSTTIALAQPGSEFLEIVASRGRNADRVLTTRFSTSAAHPQGRGLTGTAFRTRQPCIAHDFLGHDGTRHWHKLASGGGTKSGAAFPLLKGDTVVGVILFLSAEHDIFTQPMVDLLARLAENISFALANFERVEEKRRAERQISFLARHDPLTGLPNRATFNHLIEAAVKEARASCSELAVLFVDLDRFKVVNDSLGHAAGDRLLKEVGRRLRACTRPGDVVARLGGDEFVVLLKASAGDGSIAKAAGRILRAMARPVSLHGHECQVMTSIGIARFPADGLDGDELIKNADLAMYAAKQEGKNNFRFFTHQAALHSVERLSLEADLRRAVEQNQLRLHYQPKCGTMNGRLSGVEALLRWHHPTLGEQPPMKFIPLAEESGMIIPIGRWVLKTACEQNMAWQEMGFPPMSMAVNLSPRQFLDPDLLKDLDVALRLAGMRPELLQIEITESMMMQNVERAVALFEAIRSRGVRLAIDDFGTGYSSMSLMKRFPIDTIKIDRSFVRDVAVSAQDRAIATAIISMGHALGLTVVAEGVETIEQDRFLRERHCDELQGYLFSKPLPPEEMPRFLASLPRDCELAEVAAPSIVGELAEVECRGLSESAMSRCKSQ